MGEYERAERVGADIERNANTVNPRLPPIEPENDGSPSSDNEADPGPTTTDASARRVSQVTARISPPTARATVDQFHGAPLRT